MALQIFLLIVGFIVLIKGADWLIDGASSLAKNYGVSDLVIGLTIVAIGTSTPELFTDVVAAINGNTGLVIGDLIGSNITNIFLILGTSALISPLVIQRNTVSKEIPFVFVAAGMVLILGNDQLFGNPNSSALDRRDGILLLCFFVVYMYYIFSVIRSGSNGTKKTDVDIIRNPKKAAVFMIAGLALLIIGARLIVEAAVFIAYSLGVSETTVGLTVVAVGTSLPELATCIAASYRKKSDIILGNIVGSNIANIFLILGICAVIRPLPLSLENNFEIGMAILATFLLFLIAFIGKRNVIDRWAGGVFILFYVFYIVVIVTRAMADGH